MASDMPAEQAAADRADDRPRRAMGDRGPGQRTRARADDRTRGPVAAPAGVGRAGAAIDMMSVMARARVGRNRRDRRRNRSRGGQRQNALLQHGTLLRWVAAST